MREGLFQEQLKIVRAHNAAEHGWKMGVNQFTDRTDAEFKAFKGLKRDSNMEGATPFDMVNALEK